MVVSRAVRHFVEHVRHQGPVRRLRKAVGGDPVPRVRPVVCAQRLVRGSRSIAGGTAGEVWNFTVGALPKNLILR